MLFIFQLTNIILSRVQGPEAVTQYNIAYKYFNVLNMAANIILTPFWSAFTDAYIKRDYNWMRGTLEKLEKLWLLCIPILVLMVLSFSLSFCMAIYVLCQTGGNMYMFLINGTSKIRLQLIIYLSFALVSIPLMKYCCKYYGIEGILIVPTTVFILQAFIGRVQILKMINGTAKGIWLK